MVALLSVALAIIALAPVPTFTVGRARRGRIAIDGSGGAIAAAFGAVAIALLLGLALHTAAILAALALAGVHVARRSRAAARQRRLRAALPSVAEALGAAIRAGLPLADALAAIAPGQPEPVAGALERAAALLRVGRRLEVALRDLEEVFGPSSLLLRETLRAFHRRGGNVARSLERVAQLARAESELQDEVHALTAQGRASALVLALLAPCGLLFFFIASPAGARAFLSDPRGGTLLSVALALEGLGALWLWRLVRR